MSWRIAIIALPVCLLACTESKEPGAASALKAMDSDTLKAVVELEEAQALPGIPKPGATPHVSDTLRLDLVDLQLALPGMVVYNENPAIQQDTITLEIEFGLSLDSIQLLLSSSELSDLQFSEKYKTTLSIQNEGPHLDLWNWKGYESEWVPLQQISPQSWFTKALTITEMEQFPSFTKEELVTAAKTYGDEEWAQLVINPYDGKLENAYGVSVGERWIRIEGTDNAGNKKVKILHFFIPLGC